MKDCDTMGTIDLNCDMGESFGRYSLGLDEEAIKHISSANIACGWHAGDARVMHGTVRLAAEHGVGVGAHPGYPDLQGFGRRNMDCSQDEIRDYVIYQIGALMAFCKANRVPMQHVKPHGALYLTALEAESAARGVAEAVASVDPQLLCVTLAGPKGALMTRIGEEVGIRVVYEAFPDRAYTPDGTLLSRRLPGAVITGPDQVAQRAVMMARDHKVVAVDGTVIDLEAQTLCVHGDTPGAVEIVKRIRKLFSEETIEVRGMGT
ncbi:MAG: 5-oxoprolinase subunit PxpA [Thermodesulfobacteriota bacterium]